ncbi:uncharacterized protein LOC114258018 isoform X4 [Camellia sinensis]|nr:uncharacterized protein LOC114258018 isoform X3 [Camellia sinensis]XP_028053653.1 uncharacterized protein LOC114258018 isoform X4 [Camellia sinensis]
MRMVTQTCHYLNLLENVHYALRSPLFLDHSLSCFPFLQSIPNFLEVYKKNTSYLSSLLSPNLSIINQFSISSSLFWICVAKMSNFKSDNPNPAKGTPATDTPFKSDNPDPAKGIPATDTPFKSDNPDPAKGTPATGGSPEEQKTDDSQKDDAKKDVGIFAA